MPPRRKSKRATRANPGPARATTPAPPTVNQAMLDQLVNERVAAALAAANVNTSTTDVGTSRPTHGNGRGCSYQDFRKIMTESFGGTEGAVVLARWIEKLETVFRISSCAEEDRVKYASFTFSNVALTWWNNYLKSAGYDNAYSMPWENFKGMVLRKYCPRTEVMKLEAEFWNLKVQGTDMAAYNQRFQELALLCPEMVPTETRLLERYIGGLPVTIKGNVTTAKATDLHEAMEVANQLMDQLVEDMQMGATDNKRKWEDYSGNNNNSNTMFSNKKQEGVKVYAVETAGKKTYAGKHPLCNRCKLHHSGPCTVKCNNCQKIGHMARDCRSKTVARAHTTPENNRKAEVTCYGCGKKGHYRNECREPKYQETVEHEENED